MERDDSSPSVAAATDIQAFVLWAIRQLGCEVTRQGGAYRLVVPEATSDTTLADMRRATFTFDRRDPEGHRDAPQAADDRPESMAPGTPLFNHLMADLRTAGQAAPGGVVHTQSSHQPVRVGQISARLFSAYHFDQGGVHLAGCTVEDHPLVRVTYCMGHPGEERLRHIFVGADGEALAAETVTAIGVDQLAPHNGRLPTVSAEKLGRMVAVARQRAAACLATTETGNSADCIATALVWCPFAEGKLRFTVGTSAAELPFGGWAGALVAPPFVCPETGASGYDLAATDDARISVADQVAVCDQSGRRVLLCDLVECSVTGQRVLLELTEMCPVSGLRAVPEAMVACRSCQQRVSTAALDGNAICRACQSLTPIPRDDPRIQRIVQRFPALDHWRSWRIAETAAVYVLHAARWLRQLALVTDRVSLEPLYVARRNRLTSTWAAVQPDQYADVLGSSAASLYSGASRKVGSQAELGNQESETCETPGLTVGISRKEHRREKRQESDSGHHQ